MAWHQSHLEQALLRFSLSLLSLEGDEFSSSDLIELLGRISPCRPRATHINLICCFSIKQSEKPCYGEVLLHQSWKSVNSSQRVRAASAAKRLIIAILATVARKLSQQITLGPLNPNLLRKSDFCAKKVDPSSKRLAKRRHAYWFQQSPQKTSHESRD